MNAEQKIITVIIIIAILTFGIGALVGYGLAVKSFDEISESSYWTGFEHSCVMVAQLQESSCYSITQTEMAKTSPNVP